MYESAQFILAIFLLSQTTGLSRRSFLGISYLVTRSHWLGTTLYSLVYFPGTIAHEMAHFFTAAMLGVRTGNISLFPKREEGMLRMGSVEVQKTDFFRSSLIGAAPFLSGAILLLYLTSVLKIDSSSGVVGSLVSTWRSAVDVVSAVKIYLIIAISNTLFTSKEDRRHWPVLLVISLIIYMTVLVSGKSVSISHNIVNQAKSTLTDITGAFYVAIILNLFIYLVLGLIVSVLQKVLKRKIVYKN